MTIFRISFTDMAEYMRFLRNLRDRQDGKYTQVLRERGKAILKNEDTKIYLYYKRHANS